MESSRSPSFDFVGMVGELQRKASERELADALAAGFDSPAAHQAHLARRVEREVEAEKEMRARARRTRVLDAVRGQIEPSIRDALIAGPKLTETYALRFVREWIGSPKPALILSGGTGTGKTVAALWAACHHFGDVQFIRAARIGSHYERWQSDREDKIAPLDLGVELLIVDDLGLEPLEDRRVVRALEEMANARQDPGLRTIYTTNLTDEAFGTRYRAIDRFLSRLRRDVRWGLAKGTDMRARPE